MTDNSENSPFSISFDPQNQRLIVGPTNLTIQVPDGARVVNAKGELLVPAKANSQVDNPLKAQGTDIYIGRFPLRNDMGFPLYRDRTPIFHDLYAYPHMLHDSLGEGPALMTFGQAAREVVLLEGGARSQSFSDSDDLFEAMVQDTYEGGYYCPPPSVAQNLLNSTQKAIADEINAHPDRLYGTLTRVRTGYFVCINSNQLQEKQKKSVDEKVYWWPVRSVIVTPQP